MLCIYKTLASLIRKEIAFYYCDVSDTLPMQSDSSDENLVAMKHRIANNHNADETYNVMSEEFHMDMGNPNNKNQYIYLLNKIYKIIPLSVH